MARESPTWWTLYSQQSPKHAKQVIIDTKHNIRPSELYPLTFVYRGNSVLKYLLKDDKKNTKLGSE